MKRIEIVNKPKKSLGQNFLTDENISRKTVNLLNIQPEEHFLEIGPGYGSLTKHLLEKTHNLVCVEIDQEIAEKISEEYREIKIIQDNILNVRFDSLVKAPGKLRVVGNIPYNITSQIVFHAIDQRELVKDLTIMVQLEVAERIVAKPKTKAYGILSVVSQAYSTPKLLFKIPPSCFYPKPRVDSGILHFDFDTNFSPQIENHDLFRKVVRTTFAKRRKILSNSIKDLNTDIDFRIVEFDFNKRPEELSVQEFIDLSNKVNTAFPGLEVRSFNNLP
jgi:16S rRNA (adenine1518-N6/adenine1519-N6)-dimethyltransferase